MERMNLILYDFPATVAGTFISFSFGKWSDLLSFFMLTICMDYSTGLAASIKENKGFSVKTAFWGLINKLLMLLIIMLGHRMDLLLGTQVVMIGAIYFYLANELLSITENYGRLGLPLPDQVKRVIHILKSKGGQS
jgi:toxin secretion/phage lysis holin